MKCWSCGEERGPDDKCQQCGAGEQPLCSQECLGGVRDESEPVSAEAIAVTEAATTTGDEMVGLVKKLRRGK